MPGFGTSKRTYTNAYELMSRLGVTILDIDITKACELHFKQIGHDSAVHDAVYENSQARERTKILMDLANKYKGPVIGTGDLSEMALGGVLLTEIKWPCIASMRVCRKHPYS